jgi:hypothetical protein
MITETVSDIFTDFQKSLRYTGSWTKLLQPPSVKRCGPGSSEKTSTL